MIYSHKSQCAHTLKIVIMKETGAQYVVGQLNLIQFTMYVLHILFGCF